MHLFRLGFLGLAVTALVGCSSGGSNPHPGAGGNGGSGGSSVGGGGAGGGVATGGNGGSGGTGGSVNQGGSGGTGGSGGSEAEGGAGGEDSIGYNPCPAAGTPCIVMPLGDSITDGAGSSGGGYRPELFHLALEAGTSITFAGSGSNGPEMVDGVTFPKSHEGHPGWVIGQIDDSIVAWLEATNPHIVTLMIGTNDMNLNLDVDTAPDRLEDLINDIITTNSTALIVVAQIVPAQDDGLNDRIETYNGAIPAIVSGLAAEGKHVVMVDMYEAFTANADFKTEYMADNLHPNDAGYVAMANTWYDAIGPLFR
jgi:lysophospholipase L1-like esterase